ncbi:MAG: folate-binding protein, partial [Rhodoglobus sp.]
MSTELPEPARPADPAGLPSPLGARPGAVGTPPQHYGNPLAEQRALAAGTAIVDLSDRAVISITGPDRLTWLDSLTSQSLAGLAPGAS